MGDHQSGDARQREAVPMLLPPFLLNDWLERPRDLKFNLAGSAGPPWTMGELLRLGGQLDLTDLPLNYAPTVGAAALRAEIAAHHDVDPDWVVLTTGAAEALLLLLSSLSQAGGNVLLPMPAYPASPVRRGSSILPRFIIRCRAIEGLASTRLRSPRWRMGKPS